MENIHLYLGKDSKPLRRHLEVADIVTSRGREGARVLEVGCGGGQLLRLLNHKRPDLHLYAADAYQNALDMAGESANLKGKIKLNEDEFNLAGANGGVEGYDFIILCHVLEHMKNPIAVIESCMSYLNEGGRLILAVPNVARPSVLLSNIFRMHYVNKGHIYGWDVSHWRNFLERILSLDVESYHYDEVILIPGRYGAWITRVFGKVLAQMFPWWSFSNIAVVKK